MNKRNGKSEIDDSSTNSLAQAIFIVNKHAKAALEPKYLYELKRLALNKLLQEGKAKKIGLHFSDNPRLSAQQSDVVITCGEYIFHLPPSKEDLKTLPHLGNRTASIRNPKASMSLSKAKKLLSNYTGHALNTSNQENFTTNTSAHNRKNARYHNPFPSSFLGKK